MVLQVCAARPLYSHIYACPGHFELTYHFDRPHPSASTQHSTLSILLQIPVAQHALEQCSIGRLVSRTLSVGPAHRSTCPTTKNVKAALYLATGHFSTLSSTPTSSPHDRLLPFRLSHSNAISIRIFSPFCCYCLHSPTILPAEVSPLCWIWRSISALSKPNATFGLAVSIAAFCEVPLCLRVVI